MHECFWQVTLWHRFLYHRWQVPTFSLSSHDPVTLMTQTATLHVLLITTANSNINHNLIFPTVDCRSIFYFWTISSRNYFWFSQVNLMAAHNLSHIQFWFWIVPIQTMFCWNNAWCEVCEFENECLDTCPGGDDWWWSLFTKPTMPLSPVPSSPGQTVKMF